MNFWDGGVARIVEWFLKGIYWFLSWTNILIWNYYLYQNGREEISETPVPIVMKKGLSCKLCEVIYKVILKGFSADTSNRFAKLMQQAKFIAPGNDRSLANESQSGYNDTLEEMAV